MSVLVLGIGNLIMTDDGIGVRVVQRLAEGFRFPPGVELLDGGTLGLDLLPRLEGVERLLIVDAVETGKAPGTVMRLEGEEIPLAFRTKLSPHQMGLQDLLAVAELQGNLPAEMVLWGVQPASIEPGMELSPAVAERVEYLVDRVQAELAGWGISPG
ncbi:HyaD/HybD family hydrogenase maturation endopeptidase [Geobacter sp.]|uniref:HyaD/HybD family hydrogenase maturation endopeptidase n=1 Tax=Geobacter sp. TaxID=46610 RepID=UPI002639956D|nr:HyaD/HybD family hydrogenase maturation endopeptidase [Geobacter sp.]